LDATAPISRFKEAQFQYREAKKVPYYANAARINDLEIAIHKLQKKKALLIKKRAIRSGLAERLH
jgi:hypothetical protein